MKINVSQVPFEGIHIEEEIPAQKLDLETEGIKFRSNVKVKADISRITNALSAHMVIEALIYSQCSRCLEEVDINFKKDFRLNYPLEEGQLQIDFDPDIREELILEYPLKPLCSPDCKGLCFKCGANLNKEKCSC